MMERFDAAATNAAIDNPHTAAMDVAGEPMGNSAFPVEEDISTVYPGCTEPAT